MGLCIYFVIIAYLYLLTLYNVHILLLEQQKDIFHLKINIVMEEEATL